MSIVPTAEMPAGPFRHLGRSFVVILILLTAFGWVASASAAADATAKTDLPPELDLIPRDAAAFVHVRAAEIANNPVFADVRRLVAKAGPEAWKTFEQKCALPPGGIDSIALVMPSSQTFESPFPSVDPEAVSALVVVTTRTPYNRLRLMQALGHREKAYKRNLYYFNEKLWSGLVLVDDRTFVIGSEEAIAQFFDLTQRGRGPLQAALEQAGRKSHVLVGVNTRLLAKDKHLQGVPPALQPLLEADCAAAAVQLGKELRVDCSLHYQQEAQTQAGAQAVRSALDLLVQGLSMPIQELEKQLAAGSDGAATGDLPEKFFTLLGLGFFRELETLLKTAPIERRGSVVQVAVHYRGSEPTYAVIFGAFGVTALGTSASATFQNVAAKIGGMPGKPVQSPQEQHLRHLAAALEKYHAAKGTYPPAAICDAAGRPLLSWRVALLPYLGEQALYDEFKLDEPWDSMHNKRLINKMSKAYQAPNTWKRGKTPDLLFTGPNTVFEGNQGIAKTDVAGKAVLVALADITRSVYWTKPADLAYEPGKAPPSLFAPEERSGRVVFRTFSNPQAHVLLTDGSFQTIDRNAEEKTLRTIIERGPKKGDARPAANPDAPATIWDTFAYGDDAGAEQAFRGIAVLTRSPETALPLLKERLKPVPAADTEQINRLVTDLESDAFAAREKAAQALETLGVAALPALRKKLADKVPSVEARKRLEQLVRKLEGRPFSADELRGIRAAEVLRGIGTPEAQALLASWAEGAEATPQTTAARKALASLKKQADGK